MSTCNREAKNGYLGDEISEFHGSCILEGFLFLWKMMESQNKDYEPLPIPSKGSIEFKNVPLFLVF